MTSTDCVTTPTVDLGAKGSDLVVDAARGRLYVTVPTQREVVVLETRSAAPVVAPAAALLRGAPGELALLASVRQRAGNVGTILMLTAEEEGARGQGEDR